MALLERLGHILARYLSRPHPRDVTRSSLSPDVLAATLRKGDVLLVEGTSRFGAAIKYLSQSTWSHACLYIGDTLGLSPDGAEPAVLIEADIIEGVRAVPLSLYAREHTRICRPVGVSEAEIATLIRYLLSRLGDRYDLKNIVDLARYLVQTPPVPARWRRHLLQLGSGDPTRAICSSLIAQAFAHIHYPILPERIVEHSSDEGMRRYRHEFFRHRHHSLYTPRDFDLSPYFQIVKPALERGFNPHTLLWQEDWPSLTLQQPEPAEWVGAEHSTIVAGSTSPPQSE